MKNAIDHFKKVDPVLYKAFIKISDQEIGITLDKKPNNYFADLCEAIINQQLSDKVARTIFERFKKLFPKQKITPKYALKISDKKLRSIGPSQSKVNFIKDLARKIESGDLKFESLIELDDQEIVDELMKVKGIGPWTAEMFLMFSLGREDVFSRGDYGLRKAIQKLYNLKTTPTLKQMDQITTKWSPYRTYACLILWRSLD